MAHNCKNLIIHCIDFRLGKPLKNYLEKENLLGDCDILSVAGGIKNLLSPKRVSDKDFLLEQMGVSINLHKIKRVILSNHTDCGAYGGSAKFDSLEEERKFHIREMDEAKRIISGIYPELKVDLLLGKIMPSGEVGFEEIKI